MTEHKLAPGDWLIVCDGRKAVVLESVGSRSACHLETVAVDHDGASSDQLGDCPGHVLPFIGPVSNGTPATGASDAEAFLHALADRLNQALGAGRAKHLLVVAPPSALGILREAYTPAIRAALRGEVEKDLVRLPVTEIARHLFGHSAGRAFAASAEGRQRHMEANKASLKKARC